jgi:hypothetical protein
MADERALVHDDIEAVKGLVYVGLAAAVRTIRDGLRVRLQLPLTGFGSARRAGRFVRWIDAAS